MIISSSTVGMSSNRRYTYYEERKNITLDEQVGQAVKLDLSEEAKSLSEQLLEYKQEKQNAAEKSQQENLQKSLEQAVKGEKTSQKQIDSPKSKEQMKLEMLLQLIKALQRSRGKDFLRFADSVKQIQSNYKSASASFSFGAASASSKTVSSSSTSQAATGNVWTRTTVTSGFVSEAEYTAFQTTGVAKTADGREINFGVSVEMSRAFCAKYETFTQENYIATDPLVINVDSNVASVSDMKFLFDIDSDGTEEEISFAGPGSGFLALDKNGDGKINNGSELFGTKSGDGFADLAAYDEDGNGWIDEADSVFKDLKIWTKDENGKDVLMDLSKADVGAIYLGNADTEFSLKNGEDNSTNAIIRKTGIYLKESGGVGTIQHVDLAV